MIDKFTSSWTWNSLDDVIKTKDNSSFSFMVKTVTYNWVVTYNKLGYTYYICVNRTWNTIYFNTLTTKELLLEDIKEQLVSLWFKDRSSIDLTTEQLNSCSLIDFDQVDPGYYLKEKVQKNQKSPTVIIENYLKSKTLQQEDIEILKTHDIINWLGWKGWIRIKELLIPIIKKLKKDYQEEYLSKLRLIEHYSYYHDLDYYIWGWEKEFFQSNLNFCIQVKRVIPSNAFFFLLLGLLSLRGRKYFQFKDINK